ncbi:MAG: cupredoxin family copper-binding protein [Gammaproteobacteria bacterium]|jgi:plastocyanin
MRKRIAIERRASIILTLAAVALTGPPASLAGPGCMNDRGYMAKGYYPQGPMMGPRGGYGQMGPQMYRGTPAPHLGMMAGPYQRPMPAPWYHRGMVASQGASAPAAQSSAQSQAGAAGDAESGGDTITVRINGMRFEPSTITVEPGTTVTWVHESSMPHTVSGNGGGVQSGTLYRGQTFSHTFDGTGRYDYVCDFHPSMEGSVVVEESERDA